MTSKYARAADFENIGADARATIGPTVVFDGGQRFPLCILADRHAARFERAHVHMNSGGMVDGFDDSVDGSVGGLIVGDDPAVGVRERDSRARRLIVVRGDA